MRTDVKLGIGISMAVVLLVGGYFTFSSGETATIPVTDETGKLAESAANREGPGGASTDRSRTASPKPTVDQPRNVGATNPRTSPAGRNPADRARPQTADSGTPANPDTSGLRTPASRPGSRIPQPGQQNQGTASRQSARTGSPTDDGVSPAGNPDAASAVANRANGQPVIPFTIPDSIKLTGTPPSTDSSVSAQEEYKESVGLADTSPASDRRGPTTTHAPTSATPNDGARGAIEIHRTQPGDTLVSLAQAYYGSATMVPMLRDANPHITDPSRIPAGTAVKIPAAPAAGGTLLTALPHTGSPSSPSAASRTQGTRSAGSNAGSPRPGSTSQADPSTGNQRTYTVKAGDSFYRIAEKELGNANRWKELLELNRKLVNGDPLKLRPGQVVTLPGS